VHADHCDAIEEIIIKKMKTVPADKIVIG